MKPPKDGVKLNMRLIQANLALWKKQDLKAETPVNFKRWLEQWKTKNAKVVNGHR